MAPLPELKPEALRSFEAQLPAIFEEGRAGGHDVDADPYLQLDQASLVRRFLIATEGNLPEAVERLRATIVWRRDWGILDCHRPGAARQLMSGETNPGTEMYFGNSLHFDRLGRPYIVGRGGYANGANMHPWRHLRAGIFVVERMAVEVLRRGCGYGTYILDVGDVPTPGTVSGTGGAGKSGPDSESPYFRRGAGREAPDCMIKRFGELNGGMAVLRAAISIANSHYPELMARVVILRSNWLFHAAFRVFSLWVHRRTRDKFVFVAGGWTNPPMQKLQEWYAPDQLPEEWGGTGWQLGGDAFLAASTEAFDADPAVAQNKPVHGFAGFTEKERDRAEQDARERGFTRDAVELPVPEPVRPREACCCLPCWGFGRKRKTARPKPTASRVVKDPAECLTMAKEEGARKARDWRVLAALVVLVAFAILRLPQQSFQT